MSCLCIRANVRLLYSCLICFCLASTLSFSQFSTFDNHCGYWIQDSTWEDMQYPGTNIDGSDIFIYGYVRVHNCIELNKGTLYVNDTLIIYGNLHLKNNARLEIQQSGLLLVYGDYTSNDNVEVVNHGLMLVTGEFDMLGSDNQGYFLNSNKRLFIYDSEPELKSGLNYIDLDCYNSSDFQINFTCGTKESLKNDMAWGYIKELPYSELMDIRKSDGCGELITFSSSDSVLCKGDTLIISDFSSGFDNKAVYRWNFGEGANLMQSDMIGPHKISYSNGGVKTIRLTITTDALKEYTLEKTVMVRSAPEINIKDVNRCGPGEIAFAVRSPEGSCIDFSVDEGQSILSEDNIINDSLFFYMSNVDSVVLWTNVIDTTTGCKSGWNHKATAIAHPVPEILIEGPGELCNESGLYSVRGNFEKYIWQNGSRNSQLETDSEEVLAVTVTDYNGCKATAVKHIYYCEEEVIKLTDNTPYAFTPNNDGINDNWVIEGIEQYPFAKIKVYNRHGKEIFRSDEYYANDWDGRYNGEILPLDSYYYTIDLSFYNQGVKKGMLTILSFEQ